jgi:hypothetical protein
MPQDAIATPFAHRPDADWEMFCRRRSDDGPAWMCGTADEPTSLGGLARRPADDGVTGRDERAAADWSSGPTDARPVVLEPPSEPDLHTTATDPGRPAPSGFLPRNAATTGAAAGFGSATVRHLFAKVVGVAYPNPDGSSRIEAVRALKPRDLVRLEHRPDNPVDANAVAVVRPADGRQLGYLRAALAKSVVSAARGGTRYLAVVHEVTGADPLANLMPGGGQVGAVLLVLVLEGGAGKVAARQHLLDLWNGSR